MGQTDMAEKLLADYNDVFADIVNVLLFNGKSVVKEDMLVDTKVRSQYKASDGSLHEQERDVVKIVTDRKVKIALIGFENQTEADQDMPFRVIGYDGASYRSQMLKESDERYPVITMVLYFGTEPWGKGRSLYDVLDIPEELRPYVSNYAINVFEIAHLTPKQVLKFKSDFKIVADYFVQKRMKKDYIPKAEVIRHVDEVLKLMTTLTGESSFTRVAEKIADREGVTMCEVVQKIKAEGRAEGRARTIETLIKAGILPENFDMDSVEGFSQMQKEEDVRKEPV